MQIYTSQLQDWDFPHNHEFSHFEEGIQIWTLFLNDCPLTPAELSCFSEAELLEARQLKAPENQMRYLKGHLIVKRVAAQYTGRPENTFQLKKGTHGKPFLDIPLYFNLSHSGDWIAAAFSCQAEVGVDIEQHDKTTVSDTSCQVPMQQKRTPRMESIVHRFFHPEEIRHWDCTPPSAQKELFFQYWTMKEALLKGTGDGLSASTETFCLKPETPARTVWLAESADDRYASWRLEQFPTAPNCTGSIAYRVRKN